MRTPLDEFIDHELDDDIREQLLDAIVRLKAGQQYFTYNSFNVRLDSETATATVEDELDVNRESVIALDEFVLRLAASERR